MYLLEGGVGNKMILGFIRMCSEIGWENSEKEVVRGGVLIIYKWEY